MKRVIIHVDMDAFFAAVEQKANPGLRGKPVFVTAVPSQRSVVAACSYEAKAHGVKSGMPAHKALAICPNAILVEGNPQKYIHISMEILRTLKRFSPKVEPYSIDESFLSARLDSCRSRSLPLSNSPGLTADSNTPPTLAHELKKFGENIKQAVWETSGLTCSVGIAPNKLTAKMATGYNKPNGVTVVTEEEAYRFMGEFPIGKLWGVGPRTRPVFEQMGITHVKHLRRFERSQLRSMFGVNGDFFYNAARGHDDTPIVADWEAPPVKSVGHSHTLARNTHDRETLVALLHALCAKVAKRMAVGGVLGRTVTVTVRYGNFSSQTHAVSQTTPIESETMIYHLAKGIFFNTWNGRTPVRLLGISVSNLTLQNEARQRALYTDPHDRKLDTAARALRDVQQRFGDTSIAYGSTLLLGGAPAARAHGLGHAGLAGPLDSAAQPF